MHKVHRNWHGGGWILLPTNLEYPLKTYNEDLILMHAHLTYLTNQQSFAFFMVIKSTKNPLTYPSLTWPITNVNLYLLEVSGKNMQWAEVIRLEVILKMNKVKENDHPH
jgi:hypothetical protein